jgi:hypothetical protein
VTASQDTATAPAAATTPDWVSELADEVVAAAERRGGGRIVCASGLSPSGPVHLGNLREVLTPHLVADEIRRRGLDCEHLVSWDDYDRFRRVPASVEGVDESWAEHIGRPLSAVPAPAGSPYPNWAEHFKAPMIAALEALGVAAGLVAVLLEALAVGATRGHGDVRLEGAGERVLGGVRLVEVLEELVACGGGVLRIGRHGPDHTEARSGIVTECAARVNRPAMSPPLDRLPALSSDVLARP